MGRVKFSDAVWRQDSNKIRQQLEAEEFHPTRIRVFGLSRLDSNGQIVLITRRACPTCGVFYPDNNEWCNVCDRKRLTEGWTSGKSEYDKIIHDSQEKASHQNWHGYHCLRWIPDDQLKNLVEIAQGPFGKLYVADFVNGLYACTFKEDENADNSFITHKWITRRVVVKTFADTPESEAIFLQEVFC